MSLMIAFTLALPGLQRCAEVDRARSLPWLVRGRGNRKYRLLESLPVFFKTCQVTSRSTLGLSSTDLPRSEVFPKESGYSAVTEEADHQAVNALRGVILHPVADVGEADHEQVRHPGLELLGQPRAQVRI